MPDTNAELDRKAIKLLLDGNTAAEVFLDKTVDGISLQRLIELETLVKNEQPIVKYDVSSAAKASQLNYSVPNSIQYKGLNFIIVARPELTQKSQYDWFRDEFKK